MIPESDIEESRCLTVCQINHATPVLCGWALFFQTVPTSAQLMKAILVT